MLLPMRRSAAKNSTTCSDNLRCGFPTWLSRKPFDRSREILPAGFALFLAVLSAKIRAGTAGEGAHSTRSALWTSPADLPRSRPAGWSQHLPYFCSDHADHVLGGRA